MRDTLNDRDVQMRAYQQQNNFFSFYLIITLKIDYLIYYKVYSHATIIITCARIQKLT